MKIVIKKWDDWIKIYVDGSLWIDEHSVDLFEILEMLSQSLGFDLEYIKYEGYDE